MFENASDFSLFGAFSFSVLLPVVFVDVIVSMSISISLRMCVCVCAHFSTTFYVYTSEFILCHFRGRKQNEKTLKWRIFE